jgi:TetR/AcrR family transcriptional regulator, transcriptional repressor for nem operon
VSPTGKSTRSRIVEAARCLFWLNGYGLTTVNQILERAQANPGSFYHLFRTKENVLLTVLHNNTRLFVPMTVNPIFEKITNPIDRIFAILDVYRRNLVNSEFSCGCFIGKLALEIHDSQNHLHERIAHAFDNWTATIEQCFEQARHRIPQGLDLKTISTFVLTTMEGGVMLARTHKSIEPFDAALKNLWLYFELLQAQRAGEDEAKEEQQGRKAKRNSGRKANIKDPDTSPSQITNASNVGNDSASAAATS